MTSGNPSSSRKTIRPGGESVHTPDGRNRVNLEHYRCLTHLRQRLTVLARDPARQRQTVVLVLAANFSGHLPSLIERSRRGERLILVVEQGLVPLPGSTTIADLARQEGALGWGQILFERDLSAAISGAIQTLLSDESLIVVWPDWHDDAIIRQLLHAARCPATPQTLPLCGVDKIEFVAHQET